MKVHESTSTKSKKLLENRALTYGLPTRMRVFYLMKILKTLKK
jgi:hypothetical protein